MLTYRTYTLLPDGAGRYEVYRASGAQLVFAGRALFSLRAARALCRLDIILRRGR
jgi:hypothetical protein